MRQVKKIFILVFAIFLCYSCAKENFNLENPNVDKFVLQLKNGTYNKFYNNENGEKVWALMPNFSKKHIPYLIEHAIDTSHITNIQHFPLNPNSSIGPFHGTTRNYIILGEYLLWCAQGVIIGATYPSLEPILLDTSLIEPYTGLNGNDILKVRQLYEDWWIDSGVVDNELTNPLIGTTFRWL